jgi:hypothetical protein
MYLHDPSDNTLTPYLQVHVEPCNTCGLDAALPANPVVMYTECDVRSPDIIHVNTIVAVVGRIQMGNTWAIVDRSQDNMCMQFVDDDRNTEFE